MFGRRHSSPGFLNTSPLVAPKTAQAVLSIVLKAGHFAAFSTRSSLRQAPADFGQKSILLPWQLNNLLSANKSLKQTQAAVQNSALQKPKNKTQLLI